MRWLGAALILCGGLLTRQTLLEADRRARRTRRALAAAFESMAAEIRLLLTPVPRLLRRCVNEDAFFETACAQLAQGEPLTLAWKRAAAELPLPEDERETVAALGPRLDGEAEGVCAALELAAAELRRAEARCESGRRERERLISTICISISLLIMVLLL